MENAADAIKIAGELLIGLLLISLLVFVFNKISSVEKEKDQQELIAQTTAFNNKFNAFNKTSMYGTDLISVLGLAYATNKSANLETTYSSSGNKTYDGYYDPDLEKSINITFKLHSTDVVAKKTVTIYEENTDTNEKVRRRDLEPAPEEYKKIFDKDKEYSLKLLETGNKTEVVEKIKNIVIDGNTAKTTIDTKVGFENGIKYNREYITVDDVAGFDALKKCIFECKSVTYSDTGRIKEMYFEEKIK